MTLEIDNSWDLIGLLIVSNYDLIYCSLRKLNLKNEFKATNQPRIWKISYPDLNNFS